jgi:radial spoke head protein 9
LRIFRFFFYINMNVANLKESSELMSSDGYKLNHQHAALIENSLILLQRDNKFLHVFWWGRISGFEADYFIAFGYKNNILFNKKFFYSLNCVDWYLLPPAKPELFDPSTHCMLKFQGDPTHIQFCDGNNAKIHMKEEDRLACVVHLITEEAALVPRGAFYKRTDQEITMNPLFRGLTCTDAQSFTNYQLFRAPRNRYNYNLLKRQHYNYATDFFDTLDDVLPVNKSFAIRLDRNKEVVFLKSLHWPGMNFFHKCSTAVHGFRYMGDGIKNMDLLFMI